MKQISIFKKIQKIHLLNLITLFIGILVIIFTLFKSYLKDDTLLYLDTIKNHVSEHIKFKDSISKKELSRLSKSNYITKYNTTLREALIAKFLVTNKESFPLLTFIHTNNIELSKIHQGILIDTNKKHEKDFIYNSYNFQNQILLSEITYNNDLKSNSIEYILNMKTYFGDNFKGILLASIPIQNFVPSNLQNLKEKPFIRILSKDHIILYSSKKEEINKKFYDVHKLSTKTPIFNQQFTLHISYPDSKIEDKLYHTFSIIALLLCIVFIITSALTHQLMKQISIPISQLIKGINKVSKGDLKQTLPLPNDEALKTIANAFNLMTKELQKSKKELNKVNTSLELKVTKQLQKIREKDKVLTQQSKMAAMGEMIDAIAHQWKQPLNIINMIANAIQLKITRKIDISKEQLNHHTKTIIEQADHLDETINEFRLFFKPSQNIQVYPLLKTVESALHLIKNNLIQNNIKTDVNIDKNLEVLLIQSELKHLIINLVNNSIDAFNENTIVNKNIYFNVQVDSKNIILNISDNAGGISNHIINKIFTSYFTTKKLGKGSGIGLYMSKQIVEKINGTITAENIVLNNITIGSKFIIKFPKKI